MIESLIALLIVILIIAFVGGIPWNGWHGHGMGPSYLFGTLLAIVLIIVLLGYA